MAPAASDARQQHWETEQRRVLTAPWHGQRRGAPTNARVATLPPRLCPLTASLVGSTLPNRGLEGLAAAAATQAAIAGASCCSAAAETMEKVLVSYCRLATPQEASREVRPL